MGLSSLIARSVDVLPWSVRNRIKHIPVVAAAQRWIINHGMRGKEFDHRISAGPARGLVFPVRLPDDKLYWTGTWEHDVTTVIASQIRPGAVCYDIGSHRGFMAGVMACNGARSVYCFEPNPANADKIDQLAALNPGMDLSVLRIAVGAADGAARFSIMPESSMGKLADSAFQRDTANVSSINVAVRSLDSLVGSSELPGPDFIKIDIEGSEFEVLKGGGETIGAQRPTLLIEAHAFDLLQACRSWLEGRGYSCSLVQGDIAAVRAATFRVCHMLARPAA